MSSLRKVLMLLTVLFGICFTEQAMATTNYLPVVFENTNFSLSQSQIPAYSYWDYDYSVHTNTSSGIFTRLGNWGINGTFGCSFCSDLGLQYTISDQGTSYSVRLATVLLSNPSDSTVFRDLGGFTVPKNSSQIVALVEGVGSSKVPSYANPSNPTIRTHIIDIRKRGTGTFYLKTYGFSPNATDYVGPYNGEAWLLPDNPPTITGSITSSTVLNSSGILTYAGSGNDQDAGNTVSEFYQIDSGAPVKVGSFLTNNTPQPFNFSVPVSSFDDGTHTLTVWTEDNYTLASSKMTFSFVVDKTAPTIISFDDPSLDWQRSGVPVSIQFLDTGGSGIKIQQYAITDSQSKPTNWTPFPTTNETLNVSNEGQFYVHVDLIDQAGNERYVVKGPYKVDLNAPQWQSTNPVLLNNGRDYTNQTSIPIQINAADTGSGISQILVSNDNINWTTYNLGDTHRGITLATNYMVDANWKLPPGSGQKIVFVQLVDLTGRRSSVQTGFVGLEVNSVPPVVSLMINQGQPQTNNPSVSLNLVAASNIFATNQLTMSFSTDGLTWMNPIQFANQTTMVLTSNEESGEYPVFVRVCDPNALCGIGYSSIYYLNQATAPTTGGSDTTGGTAVVKFPDENGQLVDAKSITYEGLNNVYVVRTHQVKLDFKNTGAAYSSVSTDYISFSDLYSTSSPITIVLPSEDGLKTTFVKLATQFDKASLGVASKMYFLVDKTPPVLNPIKGVNGATATSGTAFTVHVDVQDNTTPTSELQYQIDSGAWLPLPANGQISITGFAAHSGQKTVRITVKDFAGNKTTKEVSFWAI